MKLRIYTQAFQGHMMADGDRTAIVMADPPVQEKQLIWLSFALVTLGYEENIIPTIVLDDWGRERRGMEMYSWIYEKGPAFPRSEVFGFNPSGRETQYFLRDLELEARYQCYGLESPDQPVESAAPIQAVVMIDKNVAGPGKMNVPESADQLLRRSELKWWLLPEVPENSSFLKA